MIFAIFIDYKINNNMREFLTVDEDKIIPLKK